MIRGFMKTTSRPALLAAAGILLGSYAYTPAKAADLGGSGCCADLEERVAELEATTARKGNRVVSLQIYGQVNKALLIWDDGFDDDAYIVDNESSGSRIGLTGKATLRPGWTAGFLMEWDYQDSASNLVDQVTDEGIAPTGAVSGANEIVIRQNNVWIESERLGRLTLGQASTAADGAFQVTLGNTLTNAAPDVGASFFVRGTDGTAVFRMGSFVSDFDAPREDIVRYDSPSLYGFILSASWGDNDYADVALRFKKEFNSVRVAAAAAYIWDDRNDLTGLLIGGQEIFGGSISVMHVPTGLFASFMAADRDIEDSLLPGSDDGSYWYVQAGVERKWLPYGSTTIYADYGNYEDVSTATTLVPVGALIDSDAERWGFGVVQKIDSAAMEIYAQAFFYSFDGVDTGLGTVDDFEDLSLVMVGSRIKF
jgi:hypothetical protein